MKNQKGTLSVVFLFMVLAFNAGAVMVLGHLVKQHKRAMEFSKSMRIHYALEAGLADARRRLVAEGPHRRRPEQPV